MITVTPVDPSFSDETSVLPLYSRKHDVPREKAPGPDPPIPTVDAAQFWTTNVEFKCSEQPL